MSPETNEAPPRYSTHRPDLFGPAAWLREGPSVRPVTMVGGSVGWLVTGHEEARTVLLDPRFSAERWRGDDTVQPIPQHIRDNHGNGPGSFFSMDPPEHTRYRGPVTRYFTVRRMRDLEPRINDIVTERLDALEDVGKPADLVEHFALPIPSLVICEMLGVSYAQRESFQEPSALLFRQGATSEQHEQATRELSELLAAVVKEKRTAPQDDLISVLTSETDLSDAEIIGISRLLLVAGHETTTHMLALGTLALLRNPVQMRLLREDDALIPTAIEELLRYLSIVNAVPTRIAREDLTLGDATIRAGETVSVSIPVVNRDDALVEDPDRLEIGRPRSHHLAFGYGIHQCLGQHLARAEMAAGYRGLLRRFPDLRLAVEPEQIRMRTDMTIYGAYELPVTW